MSISRLGTGRLARAPESARDVFAVLHRSLAERESLKDSSSLQRPGAGAEWAAFEPGMAGAILALKGFRCGNFRRGARL